MIYEVENLHGAREYLSESLSKVILSNPAGSTRYYGMRVIDRIFKTLKTEFPEKVESVIVNAFDDYSALITAKEMGYKHIAFVEKD